jgi:hypothetical protein
MSILSFYSSKLPFFTILGPTSTLFILLSPGLRFHLIFIHNPLSLLLLPFSYASRHLAFALTILFTRLAPQTTRFAQTFK